MDECQVDDALLDFFGLVGRNNSDKYTVIGGAACVKHGYRDTSDIDFMANERGFEFAAYAARKNKLLVKYGTLSGRYNLNERISFELSGVNFDIFRIDCVKGFLSHGFDKRETFHLGFPIYVRPVECLKADIERALSDLEEADDDEKICAKRAKLDSRLYFCTNYSNSKPASNAAFGSRVFDSLMANST